MKKNEKRCDLTICCNQSEYASLWEYYRETTLFQYIKEKIKDELSYIKFRIDIWIMWKKHYLHKSTFKIKRKWKRNMNY